jgi:hypothetical protein
VPSKPQKRFNYFNKNDWVGKIPSSNDRALANVFSDFRVTSMKVYLQSLYGGKDI